MAQGSGFTQALTANSRTLEQGFKGPVRISITGTFGSGTAQVQARDSDGVFADVADASFTSATDTILDFPDSATNIIRVVLSGATSPSLAIWIQAIAISNGPTRDPIVLMLRFDGTDAATSSEDESRSNHALVFGSAAQLDTAFFKFGTAALLADAAANREITILNSNDFNFDSDFTVEFWWRPTDYSVDYCQLSNFSSLPEGWLIRTTLFGALQFHIGSTIIYAEVVSGVAATGSFHHFAFSRKGQNFRVFVNGVQLGDTVINNTAISSTQVLRIGELESASDTLKGNIDDIRITKGVAVYTEDFGQLTKAHPIS